MRLIKLEILNLASLDRQEGEVIHFEEGALKDSTIFSIVGPTGSGKSTLLDAICLALYNRAPRYPRKKGDRNQNIEIYGEVSDGEKNRLPPTDCRNILTRGKKEGYSKLTFMANNGDLYRAEWYVKFMQVKFAPVITSLYKIYNEQGILKEKEEDWDTLPLIIGLDYEQFLRTVLIAQGSFANFLTAKENERYELLEKLIGCEDLYTRISNAIKEHRDVAAKAYEAINAHFTAHEKDLMDDQALETLQEEIRQLNIAEQKVKEELVKINEALNWYVTEKTFQTNLQLFQQKVAQTMESLEAAQGAFQRLKWHDETRVGMEFFRDIKNAEANLLLFQKQINVLDQQMEVQQNNIKVTERILQELKDAELNATQNLETQRPHINKARILLGELEVARQSVQEKEKAQKANQEALLKAQQELKENQSNIQKAQTSLEKAEKDFTILQEQTDLKKVAWEKIVKEAIEAFETERNKLEGVDANLLQRNKDKAEQLRNNLKNAIHIQEDSVAKQDMLKANQLSYQQLMVENQQLEKEEQGLQVEGLTKELETLQKTHTLMTSENWNMHRQQLEEGQPCPLCGATAHPYTHHETWIPVVNELETLLNHKKQCLDKETMRKQQLTQALGVNHGKLQTLQQQQLTLQQEISKLQKEWQELALENSSWTPDGKVLKQKLIIAEKEAEVAAQVLSDYHQTNAKANQLHKKMESCQLQQKGFTEQADLQLRNAEQQLTKINTYLQTELGKTNHLQQQVGEKTETWQQLKQDWKAAQELVSSKENELKIEIGPYTPDELEKRLTETKNKALEAVNQKNQDLGNLRETLKELYGQKEATQNNLQQENGRLLKSKADLDQWISTFNQGSRQTPITLLTIEELYTATDNWEAIRQKQSELHTELTTAQTTLTNEEKAHQNHQGQKPQELQEALLARKAELEGLSNAALTDAVARLQRHEAAKQQMGKLFEQRQTALQEKQEWEEITDAIGGDGKTLRKIAQCYTLRFLIEHANTEIRKFNNRYELQPVNHSLGIRVIDHDRADDIRDTTSLSGGETFIVSLGLALGLSALSSRNISFENLFIDEGFGTLDPETLATVIDSLAMLQSSQGKKVGVISHTDTMSERITTQIRIIKNGNSGSSHLEIYP